MKELVFLSGKGGAGKTVITASIIVLLGDSVSVDCDVDASNLPLLIRPVDILQQGVFEGPLSARIDLERCVRCGRCIEVCRFFAISSDYVVDSALCEGCGFCQYVCPNDAISMDREESGNWAVHKTDFGLLVSGDVGASGENSGKLVSILKEKARELATDAGKSWIVCDGPPGTGCPVISSLNGANQVLLIVEATLSGLEDAKKTADLCEKMNFTPAIIINKWDLNEDVSLKIDSWARKHRFPLLGRIPFDEGVIDAVVHNRAPVLTEGRFSVAIKEIFENLMSLL